MDLNMYSHVGNISQRFIYKQKILSFLADQALVMTENRGRASALSVWLLNCCCNITVLISFP